MVWMGGTGDGFARNADNFAYFVTGPNELGQLPESSDTAEEGRKQSLGHISLLTESGHFLAASSDHEDKEHHQAREVSEEEIGVSLIAFLC